MATGFDYLCPTEPRLTGEGSVRHCEQARAALARETRAAEEAARRAAAEQEAADAACAEARDKARAEKEKKRRAERDRHRRDLHRTMGAPRPLPPPPEREQRATLRLPAAVGGHPRHAGSTHETKPRVQRLE